MRSKAQFKTWEKTFIGIYQNCNVCSSKDIIKKMKTQAMDRKKVAVHRVYDKGLYSEFIKNTYNSVIRKNNPIKI